MRRIKTPLLRYMEGFSDKESRYSQDLLNMLKARLYSGGQVCLLVRSGESGQLQFVFPLQLFDG